MAMGLCACAEAPWVRASQPIAQPVSAFPERRFDDPPGAALPLSIGGQFVVEQSDPLGSAIHCAAALSLTAKRLTAMRDPAIRAQFAIFESAKVHFVNQAQSLSAGLSDDQTDDQSNALAKDLSAGSS